ncbi:hypothetical protein S40288_04316 [Stachybotrys chartarum IBT 40288]|nr:hypothetical protein S40288_04316 [Stachybotrys chartarum IBT 40288]
MASSRADVVGILDIIEDIDLPHPSCALLKSYVVEAFDPARAAKYLCERLQVEDASTIVADWRFIVESIFVTGVPPSPPDVAASQNIRRRDSERCCVSGSVGSICDPLVVLPILAVPSHWALKEACGLLSHSRIRDMLSAFLTPQYCDWWLAYAADPDFTCGERFPDTIRLAAYKGLKRLGAWLYGDGKESTSVQRLPFGLYLKRHSDIEQCHNEFNALRMVRHHTYIPAPKPLDIVCREAEPSTSEWYIPDPTCYIFMTQVPGQPIDQCHTVMSDMHLSEVSVQLTSYLSQLREIPQRNKGLISNTLGGACRDTRIRGETPVGPFQDEESFSQLFRFPDDPGRRGHQIVLTHGDLNARNILVGKTFHRDGTTSWKITGIVDWEFAGYMPDYWDCTRSMFERFRWPKRYNNAIQAAFKPFGDYSKELDVEIRAWESGCGV